MIRLATEEDVKDILRLIKKVYRSHTLMKLAQGELAKQLQSKKYYSFIYECDGIVGHAGLKILENIGLFNALVVDPEHRKKGVGKELFEIREQFAENQNLEYLVGYSMMQHVGSQLLYSDKFIPVGIDIYDENIYNNTDSIFNRSSSNAELVLCRPLLNGIKTLKINYIPGFVQDIETILRSININPIFQNEIHMPTDSFFAGIHPADSGLVNYGFISTLTDIDFSQMNTSNQQRAQFKNLIRGNYESNNIL